MKTLQEATAKVLTEIKALTTKSTRTTTPTLQSALRPKFQAFKTLNDSQLELMLSAALDFLADVETKQPARWLSFLGNSGTGKTFLSEMVYQRAKSYPHIAFHNKLTSGAHFAFWPKLLTRLRDGQYWIIEDLSDASLVFLDELSVEHDPSGFARDKLCELLSRRIGKWTIITSNLTLSKLSELDTRISSRMIRGGSRTIEVDALDYSLRQ